MALINEQYLKLPESYLFSEIARRISAYKASHPEADIIRMGIGDVTHPLSETVVEALIKASEEMGKAESFRGYGPEQGYDFLIETIIAHDYSKRGIHIDTDEVFISDGAKSDTGNIGDILSRDNRMAITDPVYPVYVDTNVMGGRAGSLSSDGHWSGLTYLPCTAENGFIPALPEVCPDVIYLCYPNNPTGTTLTKKQLSEWVDYAREHGSLILFDAAYEAFITEPDVPHSIYEIEGAKQVAIEFRSFSKTAGFTGLRCGYTVIPKVLKGYTHMRGEVSLNSLWRRRQSTKYNGTAYVIQRAAQATYTKEGRQAIEETIRYYLGNTEILHKGLKEIGLEAYGGINAPYVWLKVPQGFTAWSFFDRLLSECQIVGTPGVGFGPSGEGYFRLTGFGTKENTIKAVERMKEWSI